MPKYLGKRTKVHLTFNWPDAHRGWWLGNSTLLWSNLTQRVGHGAYKCLTTPATSTLSVPSPQLWPLQRTNAKAAGSSVSNPEKLCHSSLTLPYQSQSESPSEIWGWGMEYSIFQAHYFHPLYKPSKPSICQTLSIAIILERKCKLICGGFFRMWGVGHAFCISRVFVLGVLIDGKGGRGAERK